MTRLPHLAAAVLVVIGLSSCGAPLDALVGGGCAPGDVPVGQIEEVAVGGFSRSVTGGQCFDVADTWTDGGLAAADVQRVLDEFCAELGAERELNALLGHGILSASFGDADDYPATPDYSGSCLYLGDSDLLATATLAGDDGVVAAPAVIVEWFGMSVGLYEAYSAGSDAVDLSGVGSRAVTLALGDTSSRVVAVRDSDQDPTIGLVVRVSSYLPDGETEAATRAADLLPVIAAAALDAGSAIYAQSPPP